PGGRQNGVGPASQVRPHVLAGQRAFGVVVELGRVHLNPAGVAHQVGVILETTADLGVELAEGPPGLISHIGAKVALGVDFAGSELPGVGGAGSFHHSVTSLGVDAGDYD